MQNLTAADWHKVAIWLISLWSIALVLIRPKGWPEAIWAAAGACLLVICRLLSLKSAAHAVNEGLDVYLFLTGMMIISELSRREGVFDWLASHAVRASRSSRKRLFLLIYSVGTVVTIFLSNDATAVVLTPAVLAAVRAAGTEPLPYLLVCAFIANAASFVLPISNPANLVVYRGGMPPLGLWMQTFGVASVVSILVTFVALRWSARNFLKGEVNTETEGRPLSSRGRLTVLGIGFLAVVLMVSSGLNYNLGAPACVAGVLVAAFISFSDPSTPKELAKGITWSVLPLVAGLFVIVEALDQAGALHRAVDALQEMQHWPKIDAAFSSAFGIGLLSNMMNNLPSGLISAAAIQAAHVTGTLRDAVLIGVDLGPNLSITGSLATILWLIAIRREGLQIGFWSFLKWGVIMMPPALLLSVLAMVLVH